MKKAFLIVIVLFTIILSPVIVSSLQKHIEVYRIVDQYIQDARNENYAAVIPFCKEERFAYLLNNRRSELKRSKDYPHAIRFIDTYHIDSVKVKDNHALVVYSYTFSYEGYNDAGEKTRSSSIVGGKLGGDGVNVWLELQGDRWIIVDFYEGP